MSYESIYEVADRLLAYAKARPGMGGIDPEVIHIIRRNDEDHRLLLSDLVRVAEFIKNLEDQEMIVGTGVGAIARAFFGDAAGDGPPYVHTITLSEEADSGLTVSEVDNVVPIRRPGQRDKGWR